MRRDFCFSRQYNQVSARHERRRAQRFPGKLQMSLMGWFTRRGSRPKDDEDSEGLSRMDATRPIHGSHEAAVAGGAPRAHADEGMRRNERVEQRERLYGVVRESMVRAGVLSSSYKFKVLSLDPRGNTFIVMMDLAREYGKDPSRMSEIEVMIAQTAKLRFNILVSAVYWRMNDHVSIGVATARAAEQQPPVNAGRAAAVPQQTPEPPRVPVPVPRTGTRNEPLQADEVEAFKRALMSSINEKRVASAARQDARTEAALRKEEELKQVKAKGISWRGRSTARLTGYEDTEAMAPYENPNDEGERSPGLSNTQFGELR